MAEQQQDPKDRPADVKPDAPRVPPVAAVPGGIELTDDELDKVAGGAGMHHEISKSSIGNVRA